MVKDKFMRLEPRVHKRLKDWAKKNLNFGESLSDGVAKLLDAWEKGRY